MKKYLFAIILLFLTQPTFAVVLDKLYQAQVPVKSRNVADREQVLSEALSQVLVRVSGNTGIATLPAIAEQLSKAPQFVQRFSYQQANDEGALVLQVQFEPQAIVQLLQDAKLSVWGAERPLLIAWIAIADAGGKHLISAESPGEVGQWLYESALTRGLVVNLPLMDLRDVHNISQQDVWANKDKVLLQASKRYGRYGEEAVLVAKIYPDKKQGWHAEWVLLTKGERTTWQVAGGTIRDTIKSGIDEVADRMAARFAVLQADSEVNAIFMSVANIDSAADYAQVETYLRGLPQVVAVNVLQINTNEVVYKLVLANDVTALVQALSLNSVLTPAVDALGQNTGNLYYQLIS